MTRNSAYYTVAHSSKFVRPGSVRIATNVPTNLPNVAYKTPFQQMTQMDNDALAIMQNKPVLVPGEEGLADIRIVEAIYRAAKEGKRVTL